MFVRNCGIGGCGYSNCGNSTIGDCGNTTYGCGCGNNNNENNGNYNDNGNTYGCNRTQNKLDRLCDAIGRRCNCQFVIGCDGEIEERCGILEQVGYDFITLRSGDTGRYMICDTNHLQFVIVQPEC